MIGKSRTGTRVEQSGGLSKKNQRGLRDFLEFCKFAVKGTKTGFRGRNWGCKRGFWGRKRGEWVEMGKGTKNTRTTQVIGVR